MQFVSLCGAPPHRPFSHNAPMRAAIYDAFSGPVEVVDVGDLIAAPDEVIVQVKATGVCRSDWYGWLGKDRDLRDLPHVPGHEFSGVVHEVGSDVDGWRVGERVTVPFVAGCGQCSYCLAGDSQICPNQLQPGFNYWGSFAGLVRVHRPEHNLVSLPDDFGFTETAAVGCRFSTAYRAVVERGQVEPGEWVAVFGCGGVGISAIAVASALGANVVAVDTSEAALGFARQFGATGTVSAGPEAADQLKDMSDGGLDVGVDAIGHPDAIASSINALRPGGRHVQVGLLAGAAVPLSADLIMSKEIDIRGSHGESARSFPAIFDLVRANDIDLAAMVTQELSLAEGAKLLEGFEAKSDPGIAVINQF